MRASDDFEVKGVEVSITDCDGNVLERGSATNGAPAWEYVAKTTLAAGQSVTIEVTASDRPGHKATKTQVKP